MFTKTKIAPSVALILGAAFAALANDSGENPRGENKGSMAGVNHRTTRGVDSAIAPTLGLTWESLS
jgi:hypothetical protein